MSGRAVTLALVDRAGQPLGALPLPGVTRTPWWQQVDEVADLARSACGIDVTVLRLLSADRPAPPGGAVTYLAEYTGPPPPGLDRAAIGPEWTEPHPLRMPWARPGGPAQALAWADGLLGVRSARQWRTWNLSSLWRLDTEHGVAWLKEVPPFLGHEGPLLRWLDRPCTPVVLGAEGRRTLLADLPGPDQHGAGPGERAVMLADLLALQTELAGRIPDLLALGVPDLRAVPFRERVEELLAEYPATPDGDVLDDLAGGLPGRFAQVASCGVPDTLMHGDFHPGNVLDGVIIDWGDSAVAHPGFDLIRMRDWHVGGPAPALTEQWCDHWRRVVPGSDPRRALELLAPAAALRGAIAYGGFLRRIEPSERPYHADDVPAMLAEAVSLHRTSWRA